MTPIISNHVILFYLLYSLSILCFALTSSGPDLANKKADMLVKSFNIFSMNTIKKEEGNATASMVSGPSSSQPSIEILKRHSGYIPIQNTYGARMFYFFFESRGSKTDPVILWLTGGPGCGGEIAMFFENGPFHINDDLTLEWNDFSWDKISNIIYVDQPIGSGFSYSFDKRDIRNNTIETSNDLYNFLQVFFQDHPELVENDFYIVGQSYAGHYIPVLASQLWNGNRINDNMHINLKGIAIGNGFMNPVQMYSFLKDFAFINDIISKPDYKKLKIVTPGCLKSAKKCQFDNNACRDSLFRCNKILHHIVRKSYNTNYYDIRKECEGELCYDLSRLKKFLALDSVREAIGVGNIQFELTSSTVKEAMIPVDWMKNYDGFIPSLLENGIKVFIYAGEYDLVCNWIGLYRWVNDIKWSGKKKFSRVKLAPHKIGWEEVGQSKSFGPLTFLKVYNAGHMVPMDQPNVSLHMLQSWMRG